LQQIIAALKMGNMVEKGTYGWHEVTWPWWFDVLPEPQEAAEIGTWKCSE